MDLSLQLASSRQRIDGYGSGGFVVNGVRHTGNLIVLPDATLPWACADMASLDAAVLADLLPTDPAIEVLIIGCGLSMVPLSESFRSTMRQRGISVDSMDSGAACRTFNVLASEERLVAVVLFAI